MENQKVSISVVFVMDASGSMVNMGDEAIQGLNAFYDKQKNSGEFTSTLVFFNHEVVFHHKNINGTDVPVLTHTDYNRCGMTALYDAIGISIEYQKKIKTENVIFVILTDGLENCSREYEKNSIKRLITQMEREYKWLFIYMGANQNSFEVSSNIGIKNSSDYDYSPLGCKKIMETISDNVSRCITQEIDIENFKSDDINTIN